MTTTIQATEGTNVGVTNGSKLVSLGISNQMGAISGAIPWSEYSSANVALGPEEAIVLAVALLNAASNVRAGDWGGPTANLSVAQSVLSGHIRDAAIAGAEA